MFLQGKRELEASNTNHGVTSSHSFNTSRSLSGHGLLRYFVPSTPGKMKVKVGDMRTQFSRQSFAICALVCVCASADVANRQHVLQFALLAAHIS